MKLGGELTAQKLRYLLAAALLLVLLAGVAGFYLTYGVLRTYATDTNQLNSIADASDTNIATLKSVQQYLYDHRTDVSRAEKVVADSKKYRYQDDIIRDITAFASKEGLSVTSIDFADSGTQGGSATAPVAGGGLKSVTASVSIKTPVNYDSLLGFIHRIEQNITKMQIASISLSKADGGVSSESFDVEVYVR